MKELIFVDQAKTVVILASGPSASGAAAERCRDWPTIAVNDSYRLAPWADAMYACDQAWWNVHGVDVRRYFTGQRWTQAKDAALTFNLHLVQSVDEPGLSTEPGVVHQGLSSGYQAINLAFLMGGRRFVLVGFDNGPLDGKLHWFGDHRKPLGNAIPFPTIARRLAVLGKDLRRAGAEVLNASMRSHLTCFEKRPLAACLAGERVAA